MGGRIPLYSAVVAACSMRGFETMRRKRWVAALATAVVAVLPLTAAAEPAAAAGQAATSPTGVTCNMSNPCDASLSAMSFIIKSPFPGEFLGAGYNGSGSVAFGGQKSSSEFIFDNYDYPQ